MGIDAYVSYVFWSTARRQQGTGDEIFFVFLRMSLFVGCIIHILCFASSLYLHMYHLSKWTSFLLCGFPLASSREWAAIWHQEAASGTMYRHLLETDTAVEVVTYGPRHDS